MARRLTPKRRSARGLLREVQRLLARIESLKLADAPLMVASLVGATMALGWVLGKEGDIIAQLAERFGPGKKRSHLEETLGL
jgi:hypothetical protein